MINPENLPVEIRIQIERYIGDPERCMPNERKALEAIGFKAIERSYTGPARAGIEAQCGLNDTWPGDPYP